ncbi:hypothetical protein ACOTBX_24740 [Achromobacter xylosoxidans]
MQSNLILTTAQAQTVYSAMCVLNDLGRVGGSVIIPKEPGQPDEPRVSWNFLGVTVHQDLTFHKEFYHDQCAFAAAYGLRQPPDAAPLLEALQAALAYNDSVMSADGSGQFSWGPIARAAIAQATA